MGKEFAIFSAGMVFGLIIGYRLRPKNIYDIKGEIVVDKTVDSVNPSIYLHLTDELNKIEESNVVCFKVINK